MRTVFQILILAVLNTLGEEIKMDHFQNICSIKPPSVNTLNSIVTTVAMNQMQCTAYCQRYSKCSAVTYNKDTKACDIYSDEEQDCINDFTINSYKYMERVRDNIYEIKVECVLK